MTSLLCSRPGEILIIYDGECPFCSRYVQMLRLQNAVSKVSLIDARSDPAYAREMLEKGMNIDDGMLVVYSDKLYYASDAVNILAILTTPSDAFNYLTAFLFKGKKTSRFLYPVCRFFRNSVLKVLGRKKINQHGL